MGDDGTLSVVTVILPGPYLALTWGPTWLLHGAYVVLTELERYCLGESSKSPEHTRSQLQRPT